MSLIGLQYDSCGVKTKTRLNSQDRRLHTFVSNTTVSTLFKQHSISRCPLILERLKPRDAQALSMQVVFVHRYDNEGNVEGMNMEKATIIAFIT